MVSRSYQIRKIEDADRDEYARRAARAEERGDDDEAEAIRQSLAAWETRP